MDGENASQIDWSYFTHLFAFHYGFSFKTVLKLTRRQIVFYLEHLGNQMMNDRNFWAKLHGFKTKAPVEQVKWKKSDHNKLEDMAKQRYEEMLNVK